MSDVLLEVKGIKKTFTTTVALAGVSLTLSKGEIRGLIGENGSGKSTLSSIIAGIQPCDTGEMVLYGRNYSPLSMVDAQKNGVSMIVQEMGTIANLSVAENIFIGKEKRFTKIGIVHNKEMEKEAKKALDNIGVTNINPKMMTGLLNFEDRKLVEIARAMYDSPNIFIADETTTALSQQGREIIYNLMRHQSEDGKAVLFISHDIDELLMTCNAITILRDGEFIGTLNREEMKPDVIKRLMVGREIKGDYYRSDYGEPISNGVTLSMEAVSAGILKDISFDLHKGEILGIGGLSGSGMHQVGRIAFGIEIPQAGTVSILGDKNIRAPGDAIKNQMGYVSKDRDIEALMLNASIEENIVLPALNLLKKWIYIGRKAEVKHTAKQIEELSIKCGTQKQAVKTLSGGNKQKVSFAKWIGNDSDILVLDCPTRGIDILVKSYMYRLMYELKQQGKSILLITEELPELIGLSDRILIMKDGKITGAHERSRELTEHILIEEMI